VQQRVVDTVVNTTGRGTLEESSLDDARA